ncbi:MAG: leucine--tRNA ligase, partial [Flavobacteriales bacterium]|nr:leucine--tRNA ligase [Flavobacteriales bacterium]
MEEDKIGKGEVNFRLRDAIFGRQRYWGEPIPVYFKGDTPYTIDKSDLPLELPEIDKYLPTESGDPPLARATDWKYKGKYNYELSTMPGWAGSSWYFLRYMDALNDDAMLSDASAKYWENIDLYLGGAEHATGHLLYVRFWTKFLKDIGKISIDEPAKKLVNQGMIQGRSSIVYKDKASGKIISKGLKGDYETTEHRIDISKVKNDILDVDGLKSSHADYKDKEFVLEDGKYNCGSEVEKMSKRWFNVVNPDDLCERYGADTLRLYEMFLGPLEQ